jgi:hypothetical protein
METSPSGERTAGTVARPATGLQRRRVDLERSRPKNGPLRRVAALVVVLGVLGPAAAGATGYGRFQWGESTQSCRKKEPRLRPRADVEVVELERTTLKLIRAEDEARARAAGKEALARWKKSEQPKPRLAALETWIDVGGLPARATLLFIDDKLFGADVGVLEERGQRSRGDEVEALLRKKYGDPAKARGAETPEAPRAAELDAGDGTLQTFRQPATDREGGIIHLSYRSANYGPLAESYVESLQGRRLRIESAREEARQGGDARDEKREAAILDHL